MAQQPLDRLRMRLLKAGIAPRYVARYLSELRDHFADLVAKECGKGSSDTEAQARARVLLGGEDALYRSAIDRGAPRSWAATLPWLVFGIAPLLALFALFFLTAWTSFTLLFPYRDVGTPSIPHGVRDLTAALSLFSSYLLAPVLAAVCIAIALRQRLASRWVWVGLALIALVAAPFAFQLDFNAPSGRVRGSAVVGVMDRGVMDATATLVLIAIRAATFFGLSALGYRVAQRHLARTDALVD